MTKSRVIGVDPTFTMSILIDDVSNDDQHLAIIVKRPLAFKDRTDLDAVATNYLQRVIDLVSCLHAIAAAPDNHRVVFEMERSRVLEVTITKEKEPFRVHPMPSVMKILTVAELRITEATLNDEKFVTGKTIELAKIVFSRLRYACLRNVGTKSAGFPLFLGNLVFTIYG